MKTELVTQAETVLARSVAPEDLERGDYVAILDRIEELPSFLWCCDAQLLSPHDVVRIQVRNEDAGKPLKVRAVCLPFVLVKTPERRHETLDVRQCKLVRLSKSYAKAAWKGLRRSLPRKSA